MFTSRRRSLRRVVPALLALSIAAASPATALAEQGSNQEARDRFMRGVELYESGDYGAALAEFTRAYELRPHWALLLNIAQCYSNIGREREAIEYLERYLEEGGEAIPGARRREVELELRRLEALFGTLDIYVDVDGAVVSIDGREIGRSPLQGPVRVRSGLRVVEARLEGHRPARQELTVASGEALTVELTLPLNRSVGSLVVATDGAVDGAMVYIDGVERGPAPWDGPLAAGEHVVEIRAAGYRAAQAAVTLRAGAEERVVLQMVPASGTAGGRERRRISQAWFWAALGVAVAAGAAATATGVLALRSEDELNLFLDEVEAGLATGAQEDLERHRQELADETQGLALATDVLLGVAGAAALSAVVLAFFTRFSRAGDERSFGVTPSLASGGGLIMATGRF